MLLVNQAFVEHTGYTPDEVATVEEWTRRAYGERQPIVMATIRSLFGIETRVDSGERELRVASGETRTWHLLHRAGGPRRRGPAPPDHDRGRRHRAQARRRFAARGGAAQGRVPGDAGARAAQSPGADPQRDGDHATRRPAATRAAATAASMIERQLAPPGAPDRRPARRQPHHPRQDRRCSASASTLTARAARSGRERRGRWSSACGQVAERSTCRPRPVWLDGDPHAAGAGVRQPAQQRRQVHRRRAGAIWLAAERPRARSLVARAATTASASPAELLGSIFELFVQVDRSLERVQGGLGIGLTLVAAAGRDCTAARVEARERRARAAAASSSSACRASRPRPTPARRAGRAGRGAAGAAAPRAGGGRQPRRRREAWPCCCGSLGHEVARRPTTAPEAIAPARAFRPDVDGARHRPAAG